MRALKDMGNGRTVPLILNPVTTWMWQPASHFGRFALGEKVPSMNLIRGWVGS